MAYASTDFRAVCAVPLAVGLALSAHGCIGVEREEIGGEMGTNGDEAGAGTGTFDDEDGMSTADESDATTGDSGDDDGEDFDPVAGRLLVGQGAKVLAYDELGDLGAGASPDAVYDLDAEDDPSLGQVVGIALAGPRLIVGLSPGDPIAVFADNQATDLQPPAFVLPESALFGSAQDVTRKLAVDSTGALWLLRGGAQRIDDAAGFGPGATASARVVADDLFDLAASPDADRLWLARATTGVSVVIGASGISGDGLGPGSLLAAPVAGSVVGIAASAVALVSAEVQGAALARWDQPGTLTPPSGPDGAVSGPEAPASPACVALRGAWLAVCDPSAGQVRIYEDASELASGGAPTAVLDAPLVPPGVRAIAWTADASVFLLGQDRVHFVRGAISEPKLQAALELPGASAIALLECVADDGCTDGLACVAGICQ